MFGGRLTIYVATMTDLDDHDDKIQILNLVQNSIPRRGGLGKSVSEGLEESARAVHR